MRRKCRKCVFACDLCGGRWTEPTGIHLPGGAMHGDRSCPRNAKEVFPKKRLATKGVKRRRAKRGTPAPKKRRK